MKTLSFPPRSPAPRTECGFTLLEVTLAIVITVGMLVVVLFFYRQTAQLRQSLLEDTERIAAARLVLNRLTMELRTARRHEALLVSLTGTSNMIEFIRTSLPSPASWAQDDLGRALQPESDLKLVRYELAGAGDPIEATGLIRSEGPVPELGFIFADEGTTGEEAANPSPRPASPVAELLTDQLRYLRFRYWDGANWQDNWDGLNLPMGVEVSLGAEPLPSQESVSENEASLEYPFELFRRIIFVPGGSPVENTNAFLEMLRQETTVEELP
jgi:type II secretory pathway pseudopilin PulG